MRICKFLSIAILVSFSLCIYKIHFAAVQILLLITSLKPFWYKNPSMETKCLPCVLLLLPKRIHKDTCLSSLPATLKAQRTHSMCRRLYWESGNLRQHKHDSMASKARFWHATNLGVLLLLKSPHSRRHVFAEAAGRISKQRMR